MTIELPFALPTWGFYTIFGVEFIIALIASIKLLRSENHKKVGAALLVFMLVPISLVVSQAKLFGSTLTFMIVHFLMIIVLLFLLFIRTKKAEEDQFSL